MEQITKELTPPIPISIEGTPPGEVVVRFDNQTFADFAKARPDVVFEVESGGHSYSISVPLYLENRRDSK
jgi:hypothetical protein